MSQHSRPFLAAFAHVVLAAVIPVAAGFAAVAQLAMV
jgi:hypothetical protein